MSHPSLCKPEQCFEGQAWPLGKKQIFEQLFASCHVKGREGVGNVAGNRVGLG